MTNADSNDDIHGFNLDMAEFIDECNASTSHPTNHVGAIRKKPAHLAKEATSQEAGTLRILVNLNKPISHHLINSSFLAMQENTTKNK
jgi:hypothetical protein